MFFFISAGKNVWHNLLSFFYCVFYCVFKVLFSFVKPSHILGSFIECNPLIFRNALIPLTRANSKVSADECVKVCVCATAS